MSTVIRAELAKDNPYYISRHRYYELKHFCMQYKDWVKIYNNLCSNVPGGIVDLTDISKPSEIKYVRERYLDKISLVEESAKLTDDILGSYILKGVTEGLPYSYFKTNDRIPCCKDTYYELYRKFFWILNKKRDLT